MPRRSDCPSLRAAYAELLDLKKRCKLAIEEAKRTGNIDPATKLVMLCRQKAKELGQQVSPIWEQVDVTYKMPSFEELKKRFDYVSEIFDGRPWEPIEECKHISREPRKIRFEYFQVDKQSTTKKILTAMEKQGLRPALPEELICFDEYYPDAFKKGWWILVLGSKARANDGGMRGAALHSGSGSRAILSEYWFFGWWDVDNLFLCVRK